MVSGLAGQGRETNDKTRLRNYLPTHSFDREKMEENGRNDGTYKISTESTSPKRGKLEMDKVGGKVKIPRKNDELGKRGARNGREESCSDPCMLDGFATGHICISLLLVVFRFVARLVFVESN